MKSSDKKYLKNRSEIQEEKKLYSRNFLTFDAFHLNNAGSDWLQM